MITEPLRQTKDLLENYITTNHTKKPNDKALDLINTLKRKYQDIIFRPADKNLGLVALNLQDYHQMVMVHLNDTTNYVKINTTITSKTKNLLFLPGFSPIKAKFTILKNQYLKTITNVNELKLAKSWFKFYDNHQWSIPKFYVLPKIHKQDNSSRPILAATNWITTPISIIIAKILQTYISESTTIVKNSMDTITKLQEFRTKYLELTPAMKAQCHLVSLDIVNLYPSIILEKLYELLPSSNSFLKKGLKFIFESNYLNYNDTIYIQKDGIAMGTNCSPETANFYLMHLLDPFLETQVEINCLCRYLDDIFFIWLGDSNPLTNFIDKLQYQIPGIKFTFKTNQTIEFLDILIQTLPEDLIWSTHQKALNLYTYISPKSCHPVSNLKGWISAELTRYRRLSSTELLYKTTKQLFYYRLLRRGYTRSFLNHIFNRHEYNPTANPNLDERKVIPIKARYSWRNNLNLLPSLYYNYLKNIDLPTHRITFCWLGSPNVIQLLSKADLNERQKDVLRNFHKLQLEAPAN
jgi:hypothetical protein